MVIVIVILNLLLLNLYFLLLELLTSFLTSECQYLMVSRICILFIYNIRAGTIHPSHDPIRFTKLTIDSIRFDSLSSRLIRFDSNKYAIRVNRYITNHFVPNS